MEIIVLHYLVSVSLLSVEIMGPEVWIHQNRLAFAGIGILITKILVWFAPPYKALIFFIDSICRICSKFPYSNIIFFSALHKGRTFEYTHPSGSLAEAIL